jgi:hypothetical protein
VVAMAPAMMKGVEMMIQILMMTRTAEMKKAMALTKMT